MRLRDLFEAEGTDKASYASEYETLLRFRRGEIRDVLEVGIGSLMGGPHSSMAGYAADHYRPGGSLRAWSAYFPAAKIIGVDIQPDTQFETDRIQTFLCNSTDREDVRAFLGSSRAFDLIIDDGSHDPADQLTTLENLFPALRPSGLYVIEDIDHHSRLFQHPSLVEPFIDGSLYCTFYGVDPQWGAWKLIVIHRID